jgi:UDP-glucose 4-epimerase
VGLGFIGSHLVDQYIHNGYDVVILDNLSTGSFSNLNPEARYSNVYGLRQNPASESGVVSIFANRLRNGLPPIVYGDGEQIRDYIHVCNVVASNILVSQLESQSQEILNVGTGKGISLNDLLTLFYRLYRSAKPPVYTKVKAGELNFNVLSINKLSSLGWSPKINLKEGIQQLCQERF